MRRTTNTRTSGTVTRQDELFDIDQLASRLRVSVGCIRAWRIKGEGPPAIRVGAALRWDPAEVDDWLDSRRESRLSSKSADFSGGPL